MLTGGHGRGGNGQEGQENVCELHLRQRPREGPHHQQAPGSHTRMQTTNKANNNVAERPLEPTAHLGCLRVCRGAGRVCQKRIRRSATSILKYVGIWLSCKGYRTTNWVTRRRRVSYAVQNPQCAAGEAAAPAPGSPDIFPRSKSRSRQSASGPAAKQCMPGHLPLPLVPFVDAGFLF